MDLLYKIKQITIMTILTFLGTLFLGLFYGYVIGITRSSTKYTIEKTFLQHKIDLQKSIIKALLK